MDDIQARRKVRLRQINPFCSGALGLNIVYAHLNRAIRARDFNVIYVCGPGDGGPGIAATTYLESSYREIYPNISRDAEGLRKLFRQFSFPGGIPNHAAPETPSSINEGDELGYELVHANCAAFDNSDLICACVVGDGEAETGPSPLHGIPTNSSVRHMTAPCCRSFTLTTTRSPIRRLSAR
jgi:xylulose-5-phosphate/fructose-6-phosphate phosphoketolase